MKSTVRQTISLIAAILSLTLPLAKSAHACSVADSFESASAIAVDALPSSSAMPEIGLNVGFAMADFTGDTHPDLATVELNRFDSASAQYLIEIQLTEGGHQFLRLTAPFGGLLITPKDVTGDGNLDLIIRAAKSHAPVAIFVNDGCGHFSAVAAAAVPARALRELPSEFGFTPEPLRLGATAVSSKIYTAECQSGSTRNAQVRSDSLLSANYHAPSHPFLPFGLNRAPPAAA